MADLYNLLDEIDQPQEQQQEEDLEGEQEWQADNDREELDLPPALQEAAQKKLEGTPDATYDEDERVDLDDFNPEISLEDLPYTHLQQLWTQEIHSPELLSYDDETIRGLTQAVEQQEEHIEDMDLPEYNDEHESTGNDKNMKALVQSVLKIDADRVKFLLSDVLRRRLTKIEEHPLHMRTLTDRMSDGEVRDPAEYKRYGDIFLFLFCRLTRLLFISSLAQVTYLKEYGALLERHLKRTVLDHFPQEVWKKLDEPEMIDEPDLDTYVFIKTRENVVIDSGTEDNPGLRQHAPDTCLIVLYKRIQKLLMDKKVELLM
jgi:GINS complex subunit 4